MFSPHRILCSTDFSEPSYAALEVAGEWATHFDAALIVLHVVPPLEHPGVILDKSQIEESIQADAAHQLHKVIKERLSEVSSVRPLVTIGSPADQIVATAQQERADMLVIATHGLGGWRDIMSGSLVDKILFGSVTANVMRLAPCPVLTVRMPTPSTVG